MAYTKPLVTTTVYYHGGQNPIVFADAITNGKTVRFGSNVRAQLLHGDTVESTANDDKNYVIPYHAVIYATVAVADSASQTEPEDAFCVKE